MSNLYVGIDVSNATLAVTFLNDDERTVRPYAEYPNEPQGWLSLKTEILSAATLCGNSVKVTCGMESTGNMHKRIEQELRSETRRKLEVHVLNPKAVKHFSKALLKKAKTDKVDSHLIACFLHRMRLQQEPDMIEGLEELKEITRVRRRLIEDRTASKNRLHKLLRYHFPGYRTLLGKTLTKRILIAFAELPSPEDILACDTEKLAALKNGPSHKFGADFADRLKSLAKQAPSKVLRKGTRFLIVSTAKRILDLIDQIASLDQVIEEMLEDFFPEQHLTSIPGVGKVTAAAILAEVGDINRFPSKTQFVGYCGLYPIVWESGEAKRKYRMTRDGNRMLKMTLLIASAPARQYNPLIAQFYNRLRGRQKSTKVCGGAVARKLAEIVYAIMVTQQPWDPDKAVAAMTKAAEMSRNTNAA